MVAADPCRGVGVQQAGVPSTSHALGVGACFWNARNPGGSVPLDPFGEDSEAEQSYGTWLRQLGSRGGAPGARLTHRDRRHHVACLLL